MRSKRDRSQNNPVSRLMLSDSRRRRGTGKEWFFGGRQVSVPCGSGFHGRRRIGSEVLKNGKRAS